MESRDFSRPRGYNLVEAMAPKTIREIVKSENPSLRDLANEKPFYDIMKSFCKSDPAFMAALEKALIESKIEKIEDNVNEQKD